MKQFLIRKTGLKTALPYILFAVVAFFGLFLTGSVYLSLQQAHQFRYSVVAEEAVDRIVLRAEQHISLLVATLSFYRTRDGIVSSTEFENFVSGLDLAGLYGGLHGIGYAVAFATGQEPRQATRLAGNYGVVRKVFPQTDQKIRTPIVLLEPDNQRNNELLGFDLFTDKRFRDAINAAALADLPRATGKIELAEGPNGKVQPAFFVFLPFKRLEMQEIPDVFEGADQVSGFVFAPFRADELHRAALGRAPVLPVVVQTYDGAVEPQNLLFETDPMEPANFGDEYLLVRNVELAGRKWTFVIRPASNYDPSNATYIALLLGVVSLLLAAAVAVSARVQIKALDTALRLQELTERAAKDKDTMLQEMKHRLKNMIARILAIARQTARSTDTTEAFVDSYTRRLQAMAMSQDLLTQSFDQKVDLKTLLAGEIAQAIGKENNGFSLTGPDIQLDGKATRALGLTIHELATNALKYGAIAQAGGQLEVVWRHVGHGDGRTLRIDWQETFAEAQDETEGEGFGTRLIDSCIRGDLGGSVDRTMCGTGVRIQMIIPSPDNPLS